MIALLCAIASSALISILMRFSEDRIGNKLGMFLANYTVCTLLALFFTLREGFPGIGSGMGFALGLGAFSGTLYLASFLLFQQNTVKNGMVMSSTFMKLGILIPTIMAIVVFHDRPRLAQTVGILLAIGAIILLHFEKAEAGKASSRGLLLLLLLASGFTDGMANVYDQLGASAFKDSYLVVTFLSALACTGILLLRSRERVGLWDILCGVLIGIPNYFSTRFLLAALEQIPAVVVYPVFSVGTIVVITLMGLLLFHERLSRKKWAALGIILFALVLLNL